MKMTRSNVLMFFKTYVYCSLCVLNINIKTEIIEIGVQGFTGNEGLPGSKGSKGDSGLSGPRGPKGMLKTLIH